MDGVLITVRAVHLGACVLLGGEFAFALLVAGREGMASVAGLARRQKNLAMYACLVAVASGAPHDAQCTALTNPVGSPPLLMMAGRASP